MEQLAGRVERIVYHDSATGYSVIALEEGETLVGTLPALISGQDILVYGNWVDHPKYGIQFMVDRFELRMPNSENAIRHFLMSEYFQGISSKTIDAIFSYFGERVEEVFEHDIERLTEVPGIGKRKFELIENKWEEYSNYLELLKLLQAANIPDYKILKIFKTLGDDSLKLIREDPYLLAGGIRGVDFHVADRIALSLGRSLNDNSRLKSGIIHILVESAKNGNTYLPIEKLSDRCLSLLDYHLAVSDPIIEDLEIEGAVAVKNSNIYLAELLFAEEYISGRLLEMSTNEHTQYNYQYEYDIIDRYGYSEEQSRAVEEALRNRILIITGGPGTGKTTVLRGIIDSYQEINLELLIAAPTGRGAKRITELIGIEARTIHRLLEYNPIEDFFNYNESNKLTADLLIIDEVSMVDTLLMFHLLSAIDTAATTLILIGDPDQLPSIGPGNVLKDLIDSGKIPLVHLTKIFRQSENSRIIKIAHDMINGIIPDLSLVDKSDVLFIEEGRDENIPEIIVEMITRKIPGEYGFDPLNEIQIITPMHKYAAGADNLNSIFQKKINPASYLNIDPVFRVKPGDKVMQRKNNYQKNIYNGDIGFVKEFRESEGLLRIDFSGEIIDYTEEEIDQLILAYAITVHKSQGSEFPCVILPISKNHRHMLRRNLLYTAVTRASKLLIIIGSGITFQNGIRNQRVVTRFSSLLAY